MISYDDLTNTVLIKLIPRISLDSASKKKSSKDRPLQKMFNPKEFEDANKKRDHDNKTYYFWKSSKFRHGFIYKDVPPSALIVKNVTPTLEELDSFQPMKNDDQSNSINGDLTIEKYGDVDNPIIKGDKIIITRGDFKGLIGQVIDLKDDIMHIRPIKPKPDKDMLL